MIKESNSTDITHDQFFHITRQFLEIERLINVTLLSNGSINDTFLLEVMLDGKPFNLILQKINTTIFLDPELIMNNLIALHNHLKSKKMNRDFNSIFAISPF